MTDNDEFDLHIHRRIEEMIRIFSSHRGISRSKVIDELTNGDNKFAHGLQSIAEMFSITRHEVNERVSAFIEAEKEEEAERLARLISDALSREDAA